MWSEDGEIIASALREEQSEDPSTAPLSSSLIFWTIGSLRYASSSLFSFRDVNWFFAGSAAAGSSSIDSSESGSRYAITREHYRRKSPRLPAIPPSKTSANRRDARLHREGNDSAENGDDEARETQSEQKEPERWPLIELDRRMK